MEEMGGRTPMSVSGFRPHWILIELPIARGLLHRFPCSFPTVVMNVKQWGRR